MGSDELPLDGEVSVQWSIGRNLEVYYRLPAIVSPLVARYSAKPAQ